MSRDFRIEGQFNEVTQRWDIDISVDGITHYHHGKNLEVALDKAGTVVRRESGPPSDSVTVNRDDLIAVMRAAQGFEESTSGVIGRYRAALSEGKEA